MERNNKYPVILVHGFMGYGDEDGVSRFLSGWGFSLTKNAVKYLNKNGYETYGPAVGPINNAWDRTCELYARLVGGTVDYGKAHSERYGHARYGRTYPGILKDWGQPGDHAKIHLVGHSFGAPPSRLFAELLANGSEEERAVTPENELSPLFKGGMGGRIASITTLAGVNNGTTLADFMKVGGSKAFQTGYLMLATLLGDSPFVSQLIDFRLDQWGVMPNTDDHKWHVKLHNPLKYMDKIRRYNENREGGIVFEMQLKNVYAFNQKVTSQPDIYYFARPACKSHLNDKGEYVVDDDASLMAKLVGKMTVRCKDPELAQYGYSRPAWDRHDGFVNTEGGMAPYNAVSEAYAPDKDLKPGIWYTFEPKDIDHTGLMGMGQPKDAYHGYFLEIAQQLGKLPE
ncbi:MAG: hypothetical protein IIZ60_08635 [Clostridia bacterium]|nr:hypothetical protein [Clostridia bacterium]